MKLFVLCWLGAAVAIYGSGAQETSEAVAAVAGQGNEFALDLYDELVVDVDGNIFFSPLSINLALAMTYAGAREETKSQMADVMGFQDDFDTDDEVLLAYEEFIELLNDPEKNFTLQTANRLFGSEEFDIIQDFIDKTSMHFKAELERLDFVTKPEQSRVHINEWVEGQTNNKIKDLLPAGSIKKSTALVLVNAIYFKGLWEIPFDPIDTAVKTFYKADSGEVQIDIMSNTAHYNYAENSVLNSKVLEIPYAGRQASLLIILPNDNDGLEQLEEELDLSDIDNIFSSLRSEEVDVRLPKFRLTQDITLRKILGRMGMTDLFDAGSADLSGISHSRDLSVTEIVHKGFLDVNEEGTEAAAATGVIVGITSVRETKQFFAQHPFMFFIVDRRSNSFLFMGRLVDPESTGGSVGQFGQSYNINAGSKFSQLTILFSVFTFIVSCILSQ